MTRQRTWIWLIVGPLLFCGCASDPKPGPEALKNDPGEDSDYRCADMVRAVNYLRQLGKDDALATLTKYLKDNPGSGKSDETVVLLCRLLFVNPDGWPLPVFGMPAEDLTANGPSQFPIFPLALSDGVPFILVPGYEGSGLFENPFTCVKLCRNFSLVTNDVGGPNNEAAARHLVESAKFKQLYARSRAVKPMADFMFLQAGITNR